jgi:hypothetical protein
VDNSIPVLLKEGLLLLYVSVFVQKARRAIRSTKVKDVSSAMIGPSNLNLKVNKT